MLKISRGLSVPLVIGVAVAVTSCGGGQGSLATAFGSHSPSATATATASAAPTASPSAPPIASGTPAGYKRLGGTAQGISVDVPSSWVSVNLAKQTIQQAAKKISVHGMNSSALVQDFESMQKLHAVFAFDTASILTNPVRFADNISAYCLASDTSESGGTSVQLIAQAVASEFKGQGATHVSQRDLEVGGVPGLLTSYELTISIGHVYGSQLEVLPKPGRACFVTLSVGASGSESDVITEAAATASFS